MHGPFAHDAGTYRCGLRIGLKLDAEKKPNFDREVALV
jgi:hypothetical protein